MPRLSVIIVNYNTAHLLPAMFDALRAAAHRISLNCILIDNASRDGSADLVRKDFPDVHLITSAVNVGFGRANNLALPHLEGDYVLLLNTDAFVSPDTLEKTIAYMDAHPRCGVLGVKLVSPNGVLQPSARAFPTPWSLFLRRTGLNRIFSSARMADDMARNHELAGPCGWVPGCYYLTRKEVIDQVGLFDPRYFLYYEEVDHCLAVTRAGWEVMFYPGTTVVHIGGESAKSDNEITQSGRQIEALQIESELLYFRKNYGVTGVWMDVLLSTLADVIAMLKRVLKRKSHLGFAAYARRIAFLWSLFKSTRWGTHPLH